MYPIIDYRDYNNLEAPKTRLGCLWYFLGYFVFAFLLYCFWEWVSW